MILEYIIGTASCACALSACFDILSRGAITNVTSAETSQALWSSNYSYLLLQGGLESLGHFRPTKLISFEISQTCLLTLYLKIFRPLFTLVYFRWCSRQPSWHFSFHHYFAYDDDFFQRSQKISHVQPHNERYQFDVLCYHCWFWSLVLSRIQLESFYAFWTKGKSKWPLRLFEVINIKIGQYEVKSSL